MIKKLFTAVRDSGVTLDTRDYTLDRKIAYKGLKGVLDN